MRTYLWLGCFVLLLHTMALCSGNSGSSPVAPLGGSPARTSSEESKTTVILLASHTQAPSGEDTDDVVSLPPGMKFDEVAGIARVDSGLKEEGSVRPAKRLSVPHLGMVVRPGGASVDCGGETPRQFLKRANSLLATPRRMGERLDIPGATDTSDGDSDWSAEELPAETSRLDDLLTGAVEELTYDSFYATWVALRLRVCGLKRRLLFFLELYVQAVKSSKIDLFLDKCNKLLTEEFAKSGSSAIINFSEGADLIKQYTLALAGYEQALTQASMLRMGAIRSSVMAFDIFEPRAAEPFDVALSKELLPPTCSDCPVNHGRKMSSSVFDVKTGFVRPCSWCAGLFLKRLYDASSRERLVRCLTDLVMHVDLVEGYLRPITPDYIE